MSTFLIVSTGTGNSLYVADRIPHDGMCFTEDLLDGRCTIPEDTDRLGLIFPVYCGGLPWSMRRLVSDVLAERDNHSLGYIFAIATNGGLPLYALHDMDRTLQDNGLALSYGNTVRMPDAYLPLKKKAVTENEAEAIAAKAEDRLSTIISDVQDEKIMLPHKGPFARIIRKLSSLSMVPGKQEKLTVDSSVCSRCGTCISICPMENIKEEDGGIVFGDRCVSCFACYHRCPEGAIRFPGASGQYRGLVETTRLRRR